MALSRRNFLASMGKTGVLVAAGSVSGGALGQVGADLYTGLYERGQKALGFGASDLELTETQRNWSREIILGNGLNTRILPATFNSVHRDNISGGVTSPAKAACDAIVRLLEINSSRIETVSSIRTKGFAGNICSIGGPIANIFTELFFGQDGNSPIFVQHGEPLRFPMYIDNATALAQRDVGGAYYLKDGKRQPVWRIARRGAQIVPSYSEEGLQDDFLLVTRIPNFLDENFRELGTTITFIAGANGVGTRATKLLLKADSILQEMARACHDVASVGRGWQALVYVPKLDPATYEPLSVQQIVYLDEVDLDVEKLSRQCREFAK